VAKICSQCVFYLRHDVGTLDLASGYTHREGTGVCALNAGEPGVKAKLNVVEAPQPVCSSFEKSPEAKKEPVP
jgi:hypothetical protein